MDPSDRQLLDEFVTARDESAFRLLVQRHLPLVHGVARRVTASEDLARDVAQETFIRLARRAALVPPGVNLGAWLHRIARHAAIDLVRAEMRRKKREQATLPHAAMTTSNDDGKAWEALAPVVDELVDTLPATDRDLLVARFYLNESHATIAGRLGLSEVLARKRTSRALEKLRVLLGKRGIATSCSALAMLLPAYAATPAPAALMTTVVSAAQGVAPLVPGSIHAATLAMNATQKSAIAAAAVIFLGSLATTVESHLHPVPTTSPVEISPAASTAEETSRRERSRPAMATAEQRMVRLKEIVAIENLVTRRREMIAFLDSLAPGQFKEAADYLTRPDRNYTEQTECSVLMAAWAKVDPLSALASLNPADPMRDGSNFNTVLKTWGAQDPQAAIAWAKANPPEGQVNRRLIAVLAGLAATDPGAAFREIRELPEREIRLESLRDLQRAMDEYQAAATERLLALEDDAGTRTALVVNVTSSPFIGNTPRAARLLAGDPGAQEQVNASAIFANWTPWDPAVVLDFIKTLPEGKMRNEAAGAAMLRIVHTDPRQALELADAYPQALSDRVTGWLAPSVAKENPVRSVELALTMKDEAAQLQTLSKIVRQSGLSFPGDSARIDWLKKSGVPAGLSENVPAEPIPDPPPSPPFSGPQ